MGASSLDWRTRETAPWFVRLRVVTVHVVLVTRIERSASNTSSICQEYSSDDTPQVIQQVEL